MKNTCTFIATLLLLLHSTISAAQTILKAEITGITGEAKQNIASSLDVESMRGKSSAEIQQFFASSSETVKKALEPFGYFKATIQSSLLQQQNTWIARFQVIPGPPIQITTLDVNVSGAGIQDPDFQKIITDFPLAKNQIFSVSAYNKAKKLLLSTALARGYFDARLTQTQIKIDLRSYTSHITLHFNTGMRYRFGQLFFNDNLFDTDFLKRFSPFTPDECYTADKVQEFQQALTGSNYFREVTVAPEIDQKKDQIIPISVSLMPLPEKQYNLGLGYGTDTGVRGLAGFEWRRVTASGQRFKAETQASQINTNFQMNYSIPGKKPAIDQYVLTAATQQENQTLGKSYLQKIMASYVTTIWGWQQTAALALQRERSMLENAPYQTQLLLIPDIRWSRVLQDDPLHPSRGSRISLNLLGAPDLFANTGFLQAQLDTKIVFPILEKNRLLLRGSVGYTVINNINDLPLSLQFLAGGTQSIRGYNYNSVGPGTNMWIGSVEYRQHVTGDWYAAAFFDTGNVSNNAVSDIKKGIGLGVVWQSPLGALELTIAQAQDLPGKPLAVQFSMGPDL